MGSVVLVTGGAGYIGSHVCKGLAQAGYHPVVFDNLERGNRSLVKWGGFERGDIRFKEQIDRAVARVKPDAVVHLAGYAYVGESAGRPDAYYLNNVCGTLNLLNTLVEYGIKKLVFSSTCAVYGVPRSLPIAEDTPHSPISPYGASKSMVETMLRHFDNAFGVSSVTLRYFNAAGADLDNECGELHVPETHLIPLVIEAASNGERACVQIFGDDYPTEDGTCVRDYVHVVDIASAHVMALQALNDGGGTDAFNLSNGTGYSVGEIIKAVEHMTGRKVSFTVGPRRPGDPPLLIGDGSKARDKLGWVPRYSSLTTIIETAWRWHEKNKRVVP
jgi:UDP-arabinose 4-epimerase